VKTLVTGATGFIETHIVKSFGRRRKIQDLLLEETAINNLYIRLGLWSQT
jgi:hypothetical protein